MVIICMFCCDLHLPLMLSGLLQEDQFKRGLSLAESFLKQNYCHTCHTRFAVIFCFASCRVSSLLRIDREGMMTL